MLVTQDWIQVSAKEWEHHLCNIWPKTLQLAEGNFHHLPLSTAIFSTNLMQIASATQPLEHNFEGIHATKNALLDQAPFHIVLQSVKGWHLEILLFPLKSFRIKVSKDTCFTNYDVENGLCWNWKLYLDPDDKRASIKARNLKFYRNGRALIPRISFHWPCCLGRVLSNIYGMTNFWFFKYQKKVYEILLGNGREKTWLQIWYLSGNFKVF